jgi:hypothetical protein
VLLVAPLNLPMNSNKQECDFIVAGNRLNLIMLSLGQQEQFDCMIALFSISHLTEFSACHINPE